MYIHLKVTPNSKKEAWLQVKPGYFKVSVKEPAERNLANDRIRQMVAREFGVRLEDTRIVNGHNSPSKLLVIPLE